ncbi:MAG: recombinase family protein [Gemmatimonadota bacterium]
MVVREADFVVRLAYTRTQAAQALGISRSTLRRLLPYVETIEMPWGGKLIPVDELERLASERRQAALARRPPAPPGRKPSVPPDVLARISAARAAGRSFRQIAADLNANGVPTAHAGRQWWPSTVRAVLVRSSSPGSAQGFASGNRNPEVV